MRLLITGAAGHIGTTLSQGLSGDHVIRGLDLRAFDGGFPGEFVVGDCADPDIAMAAVAGVDAVVHLAGISGEAELPSILHSHVETTAALLDAMVQHGVQRMAYASSNHAVGMTPRTELLGVDTPFRPDTFYGVGKVAAEALLQLYADRRGISSVAMRIGSFRERPQTRRELSTWLSPGDCIRMVRASISADFDGVRPIYGISANRDAWWDLEPGRAIGYEPVDDASAYEDDLPERPEDASEVAYVGGPYAVQQFTQRPFTTAEPSEEGSR
jgi:uronate dehydrogenase